MMKWCATLLFSIPLYSLAAVLPIGIPDPGFGLDATVPARPDPWTSEQAGYYYINHGTGNDSQTYGTPSAPRQHIPSPIPSGAYVEVHGTYAGGGTIHAHGTAGSPAWLVGLAADKPTFTGEWLVNGSYLYVDGIYAYNDVNAQIQMQIGSWGSGPASSDHIMIRNSEFEGDGSVRTLAVVVSGGDASSWATNSLVVSNYIHNLGDMVQEVSDQDPQGVTVSDYSGHTWVLSNRFERIASANIRVGGATASPGPEYSHDIFCGANFATNFMQEGFWFKYASNVVFSQNVICNGRKQSSFGDGHAMGGQYTARNIWFIFNEVYDCPFGVRIQSMDGASAYDKVYVVGNLFRNGVIVTSPYSDNINAQEAGISTRGASMWAVNNTIHDFPSGIVDAQASGTQVFQNNICSSYNGGANGSNIRTANTGSVINNCDIYQSGGEKIRWDTSSYTVAQLISNTSTGDGSVNGDPGFVSSSNFRLSSTDSPAYGSGLAAGNLTLDVYDLYLTTFGVSIQKDIAGTARPQEATWEMGAYEYGTPPTTYGNTSAGRVTRSGNGR